MGNQELEETTSLVDSLYFMNLNEEKLTRIQRFFFISQRFMPPFLRSRFDSELHVDLYNMFMDLVLLEEMGIDWIEDMEHEIVKPLELTE